MGLFDDLTLGGAALKDWALGADSHAAADIAALQACEAEGLSDAECARLVIDYRRVQSEGVLDPETGERVSPAQAAKRKTLRDVWSAATRPVKLALGAAVVVAVVAAGVGVAYVVRSFR